MSINTNNRVSLNPKRRWIILLLLIPVALLFAVRKNDHIILYREDFETGHSFSVSKQAATSYAIRAVDSPVYTGKKAGRFELRANDPENNNGTRAELSFPSPGPGPGLERWYSFALFFPGKEYDFDTIDEVISQWHQGGRETPSLCIRTMAGRIRLRIKADFDSKEWIELGPIEKDKWRYYVLHVKHSSGADGLVELWRDNVRLVHHKGPNMYDLRNKHIHTPGWKLGIYKSNWNGSKTTGSNLRVLYFDDIKVGSGKASYADMRASAGSVR